MNGALAKALFFGGIVITVLFLLLLFTGGQSSRAASKQSGGFLEFIACSVKGLLGSGCVSALPVVPPVSRDTTRSRDALESTVESRKATSATPVATEASEEESVPHREKASPDDTVRVSSGSTAPATYNYYPTTVVYRNVPVNVPLTTPGITKIVESRTSKVVDTAFMNKQVDSIYDNVSDSIASSLDELRETFTTAQLTLTGELRDVTDSSGANGYVLTSTASGVRWVATSTLGLGGSGGGLFATDVDTSSELAALLGDETGTGRSVFSLSPVFGGTASFAALTATGTVSLATTTQSGRLTLSGAAANIALGSNFLSGDGGDEGIFVSSAGLIGAGTVSPDSTLHVRGANTQVGGITIESSSGADADRLAIFGSGNFTSVIKKLGNSGPGNWLEFQNSTGATEMTLDNLGRLGVGTSSPSQELTVAGDLRLTGRIYDSSNSAGTSGMVLRSTGTGQTWVATSTLGFGASFSNSAGLAALLSDETGTGNTVFSASPTFTGTVNAAAATLSSVLTFSGTAANIALGSNWLSGDGGDEGVFVSSTGNVGIGTSTPFSKLDVYGTISLSEGPTSAGRITRATTTGYLQLNGGSGVSNGAGIYLAGNNFLGVSTLGPGEVAILGGLGADIRFQNNTLDLMTIKANGNVGIGTTTPSNKLTVAGSANFTGTLTVQNSSTTFAAIANIYNSTNAGLRTLVYGPSYVGGSIFSVGANGAALAQTANGPLGIGTYAVAQPLIFGTNSTEKMRITSAGNVGIGTTTPTQKLDVVGTVKATNGFLSTAAGVPVVLSADAGGAYLEAQGANNLRFFTNTVERLHIAANGNVGIGTTTPTSKLVVSEASDVTVAQFGGYVNNFVSIGAGGNITHSYNLTDKRFTLASNGSVYHGLPSTYGALGLGSGGFGTMGFIQGGPNRMLDFFTDSTSTASVRFAAGGNVGIGNSSPSVYQRLTIGDTTTASSGVQILTTNTSFTIVPSASVAGGTAITNSFVSGGYGPITISNGGAEVMRITSSGNIGIGTTTPSNKLTVAGSANFTGTLTVRNANPVVAINNTSTGAPGSVQFSNSGTLKGLIGVTAAAAQHINTLGAGDLAIRTQGQNIGFSVDSGTSEALRITSAGNIGIGTTTAPQKLSVSGNATFGLGGFSGASLNNDQLVQINSRTDGEQIGYELYALESVNNRRASFYLDDATGIYGINQTYSSGGNMAFDIGNGAGGSMFRINPSGNVGIGTTTPSAKLYIEEDNGGNLESNAAGLVVRNKSAGGYAGIQLDRSNDLRAAVLRFSTANANNWTVGTMYNGGTPNSAFSVGTDGSLASSKLLVTTAGNVGIGTTTPITALDVVGGIWTSAAGSGRQSEYDLAGGRIAAGLGIYSYGPICTGNATGACDSTSGVVIGGVNTAATVNIPNTGTTFFNGGSVGIGTTTPSHVLDIEGTSLRLKSTASSPAFWLTSANTGNSTINLGGTSNPNKGRIFYTDNSDFMSFYTADTEQMRITASGDIAIGTTTAYGRLSNTSGNLIDEGGAGIGLGTTSLNWRGAGVGYVMGIRNTVSGTGANGQFIQTADTSANSKILTLESGTASRFVVRGNGSVGIGTSTPTAQLHTTGSVRFSGLGAGTVETDVNGVLFVSSDERLKIKQSDYSRGIEAIMGLEPISYKWKASTGLDTANVYTGFFAQNVDEYIPEAVGEGKNGYLTLSDRPIVATLVNAVKELVHKFEELAEKLTTKEVQTDKLCVGSVCVTESELESLILNSGQNDTSNEEETGGGETSTEEVTEDDGEEVITGEDTEEETTPDESGSEDTSSSEEGGVAEVPESDGSDSTQGGEGQGEGGV